MKEKLDVVLSFFIMFARGTLRALYSALLAPLYILVVAALIDYEWLRDFLMGIGSNGMWFILMISIITWSGLLMLIGKVQFDVDEFDFTVDNGLKKDERRI